MMPYNFKKRRAFLSIPQGGRIEYVGTTTELSVARAYLGAASVGDYAIFAGGFDGSAPKNTVDAYSSSLTRSTPTALSQARSRLAGASNGTYALFAGGGNHFLNPTSVSDLKWYTTIDAYSASLTRTTPATLSVARENMCASRAGEYTLFAGGGTYVVSNVVDAYNASLTRSTPTNVSHSVTKEASAAVSVGDYALFGGYSSAPSVTNYNTSVSDVIEVYDANLTHSTPMTLSVARGYLAAASAGGYAVFAGGYRRSGSFLQGCQITDVYTPTLTRILSANLGFNQTSMASASVHDCALFAGNALGDTNSNVYNEKLVLFTVPPLSVNRLQLGATAVGDYILMAGGYGVQDGAYKNVVDVFKHKERN